MRSLAIALTVSVVLGISLAQAWIGAEDERMLLRSPSAGNAAFADVVLIGRGTQFTGAKMRAAGKRLGDKRTWDYRFVTVEVIEVLKGPKELKNLDVGVIDFINRFMDFPPQVVRGTPALFFLEKQEGRYFAPQHYHVAFDRPSFHECLGYEIPPYLGGPRKYSHLLAETRAVIAHWGDKKIQINNDPQAWLRSSSLDDRLYAVQLLIERYRTLPGRAWVATGSDAPPETDIDAEESRLILRTLAEADLDYYDAHRTERDWQASNLRSQFYRLGIAMDPARSIILGRQCFRDWLTQNADTYRLRRFLRPDETKEFESPTGQASNP